MYMFTLLSSGWYAKWYEDFKAASFNAKTEIENGNTVAFGEDIEYFAEQLKISVDSIKEVE